MQIQTGVRFSSSAEWIDTQHNCFFIVISMSIKIVRLELSYRNLLGGQL